MHLTKPDRSLRDLEEERVVPWGDPGLFCWHLARYHFAASYAVGKRLLDVGCGEGYGSALLAQYANEVVGVDYSPAAVMHARKAYLDDGVRNLRFEMADATALDPALGRFDVITCFELIEHLENQGDMLSGLASALCPGGVLILSTPNRLVEQLYERITNFKYPYHVGLLTPSDLRRSLRKYFRQVTLHGQSRRGGLLYTALKAMDVFNVRHRLVRSRQMQVSLNCRINGTSPAAFVREDFQFNRWLVRQSPIVVATAMSRD
jgi:ubiquinone biosynthesis O-methyltransferase